MSELNMFIRDVSVYPSLYTATKITNLLRDNKYQIQKQINE